MTHPLRPLGLLPAFVLALALTFTPGCGDDDSNQNQNVNDNVNDNTNDNTNTNTNTNTGPTYVGSTTCETCHTAIHADFAESGHPYKLNPVVGDAAPTYPHSSVPNPPASWTWADLSYVIGGYFWKARFIDNDGYIVTGADVQYNLVDGSFTAYHDGEAIGTKPYNCGACHTTGWVAGDENGPHQDDLPGMHGTFAEPGIGCEACHGPGSEHVAAPSTTNIVRDSNSSLCGQCHTRDSQNRVEFSGGFVRHHEQYDEWLISPHNAGDVGCNTCHNPHQGTLYFGSAGLNQTCEDCHTGMTVNHNGAPTCIDCHMPNSAKSALAVSPYQGDVRSHMFAIGTTDATWGAMTYEADGKTFLNGPLTLDYACYSCHQDESGVGGTSSIKTMIELSNRATGIHQ